MRFEKKNNNTIYIKRMYDVISLITQNELEL